MEVKTLRVLCQPFAICLMSLKQLIIFVTLFFERLYMLSTKFHGICLKMSNSRASSNLSVNFESFYVMIKNE